MNETMKHPKQAEKQKSETQESKPSVQPSEAAEKTPQEIQTQHPEALRHANKRILLTLIGMMIILGILLALGIWGLKKTLEPFQKESTPVSFQLSIGRDQNQL